MMFIKSTNGAVLDTGEIAMVGKLRNDYYDVILKSGLNLEFSETGEDADFTMSRTDLLKKWLDDKVIASDTRRYLTSD